MRGRHGEWDEGEKNPEHLDENPTSLLRSYDGQALAEGQ